MKSVIAFYPGAGGNRYLRLLQGLDWTSTNVSYDQLVRNQEFEHRYLLNDIGDCSQQFVLTHCLNEEHILTKFPNHNIVFIVGDLKKCLQREWAIAGHDRYLQKNILSDYDRIEHYNAFKDELWPICSTLDDLMNLPATILSEVNQNFEKTQLKYHPIGILREIENSILGKVNSAYEIICWHKKYYKQYPPNFSNESTVIDIDRGHDEFSTIMKHELELYDSEIFNEVWNKLYE